MGKLHELTGRHGRLSRRQTVMLGTGERLGGGGLSPWIPYWALLEIEWFPDAITVMPGMADRQ